MGDLSFDVSKSKRIVKSSRLDDDINIIIFTNFYLLKWKVLIQTSLDKIKMNRKI